MKKIIALLLVAVMLTLCACGSVDNTDISSSEEDSPVSALSEHNAEDNQDSSIANAYGYKVSVVDAEDFPWMNLYEGGFIPDFTLSLYDEAGRIAWKGDLSAIDSIDQVIKYQYDDSGNATKQYICQGTDEYDLIYHSDDLVSVRKQYYADESPLSIPVTVITDEIEDENDTISYQYCIYDVDCEEIYESLPDGSQRIISADFSQSSDYDPDFALMKRYSITPCTINYTYDTEGLLASVNVISDDSAYNSTVTYQYNENQQISRVTAVQYGDTFLLDCTYDDQNRLVAVDMEDEACSFEYLDDKHQIVMHWFEYEDKSEESGRIIYCSSLQDKENGTGVYISEEYDGDVYTGLWDEDGCEISDEEDDDQDTVNVEDRNYLNWVVTASSGWDSATFLGLDFDRTKVATLTFVQESLDNAPDDAQDVSEAKDGSILLWGVENNGLYDVTVASENTIYCHTCYGIFADCINMTGLYLNDCLDTSEVTDMSAMFIQCPKLTELNLSGMNTSNATNMGAMFRFDAALTSLDLSFFDTSNVTVMAHMFDSCSGLVELNVSGFNTSNVNYMQSMFENCNDLERLDVGGFDTSNVQDMGCMFSFCEKLESLDVSGFDTSNVTDMYGMFKGCYALTDLDTSGFVIGPGTDTTGMFD